MMVTPAVAFKKAWGTSLGIKLVMVILVYLEPIKSFYHLMVFGLVVNFILGWYTNKRLLGEKFSAVKARGTAEKLAVYTVYITIIYVFEKVLLSSPSGYYATRIVTALLILAELKSISENGDRLTNHKTFTTIYKVVIKLFPTKIPKEKGSTSKKE